MKRIVILMFALTFTLGFSSAYAKVKGNTITTDVEFSEPKVTPSTSLPGYDHIEMQGIVSLGNVGEPVLPIKGLKLLIPPNTKVKDVEVILGEKVTLPGVYRIEPGQKEYPISQIDKIKIMPDQPKKEIYESDNPYPADVKKFLSHQKKMGYSMAILSLHPVEYIPAKGQVSYYKSMSVLVRFHEDKEPKPKNAPKLRGNKGIKEKDQQEVQRLINNPEDLTLYDQALSLDSQGTTPVTQPQTQSLTLETAQAVASALTPGQYSYVIITRSDFVSAFEPLKTRRTQDGLLATIVTTDWIYANYPGTRPDGTTDNQTKIRNFIINAYNNWGTRYLLLAGDADGANVGGESGDNIVPVRGLSDWENNIPADLYYSCLDGTFDFDGDGIYGERTDGEGGMEVDLLAEVIVGRAPVDSVQETSNFVKKIIAYEDSAADTYLTKNYMLGEFLGFGGISTYATAFMEEIRLGSSANGYTTKGFLSNPDRAFDAKSLYDDYMPEWNWSKSELINIINQGVHILNHLGHANVTGCMKLNNPDADALTNNKYFIVNSQGCYSASFDNRTTDPALYSSQDCIAEHLITNAAGAVAYIGNSRYGYGQGFSTDSSSQSYQRRFWDSLFSEGIAEIGRMNQDSKEDNIPYLNIGPWRYCYFVINLLGDPALKLNLTDILGIRLDHRFSELTGNQNGILESGETAELAVTLTALNKDADNVQVLLSTEDPYIIIEQNISDFGFIARGESRDNNTSLLRFRILEDCPAHYVGFKLSINSSSISKEENIKVFIDKLDPRKKQITLGIVQQLYPAISGNYIVWEDYRNGNADIYLYDLTTNVERRITSNEYAQRNPAISGNYIVWEDYRNGNADIYLYDIASNTDLQITSDIFIQQNPSISGNYIVWEDSRNSNWDIYLYDIINKTGQRITTDSANQSNPSISGNYIVWEDYRNGNADIYLYDMSTGVEKRITNNFTSDLLPVISGNYIVWVNIEGDYKINLYDIALQREQPLSLYPQFKLNPYISDGLVVWSGYDQGNPQIYLYDLRPLVSITVPQNNQTVSKDGFNFTGIAVDDSSGVKSVSVDVFDFGRSIYTVKNEPCSYNSTTKIWNFQVPSSYITQGRAVKLCVNAKNNDNFTTQQVILVNVEGANYSSVSGQTPWNTNKNGPCFSTIDYNYTMGYHFTPLKDGKITKLGGLFNGTKTVYIWEKDTGTLLAQALVTSKTNNLNLSYTPIIPVNVRSGKTYTIAAYLSASGGSYRDSINTLPKSYGDVIIEGATYIPGDARPVVSDADFMYGQVDIEFVPSVNNTPILNAIGNKSVNEGQLLQFTISATDADGDTLSYSATNLPSGATFNTSTRTFSWTPNFTQAGIYSGVHFEVSDGRGGIDSEDITITVNNVPQLPNAPSNPTATAVSSSQINLTWLDNSTNETGFKIERKTGSTGTYSQIATVSANVTSYSNTGLTAGTTYYYRIRAYNADGDSSYSNEAYATTQTQATIPVAPTNLTATAVSKSQINISWLDKSSNEAGFIIERSDRNTSSFRQIATVAANVTSYQDNSLSKNTTYYYRVKAYNASGESSDSNIASATTLKR